MQQKYCDHGRSTALLTMTWPICRARSSCGSGGKPRKASILPSANSSIGFGDVLATQWMSLRRIEPDMGRHHEREDMMRLAPKPWTPTLLPFRSAMLRMPSFPNSSKQPTCTPASTVTGAPRSMADDQWRRKVQTEYPAPQRAASSTAWLGSGDDDGSR